MNTDNPYDIAIIGGGINGCGIARDAAGRGLRVFLAEQDDLASATSSWSTKLIHGGLRYLEQYAFRLVRESLQEREVLLKLAVHHGDKNALELFSREFIPAATSMAQGITGFAGGRPAVTPLVRLFSFLIPKGHEAEYFSVYEISDKGTSWLGPLTVGLALQWTGNFRLALLSLMVFFAVGLVLLSRVDMRRAAGEAGNQFA